MLILPAHVFALECCWSGIQDEDTRHMLPGHRREVGRLGHPYWKSSASSEMPIMSDMIEVVKQVKYTVISFNTKTFDDGIISCTAG